MQSADYPGVDQKTALLRPVPSPPGRKAGPAKTPLTKPAIPDASRRRANAALAVGLVLIVLLAPLPVGSNRGAVWMLWAMALGLGASLYFFVLATVENVRPFRAVPLLRWFWFGAAALFFALVQVLPVAPVLPAWVVALPESVAQRPASLSLAPAATLLAVLRGATLALFLFLMIEAGARLGRALAVGWALFSGVAVYALWSLASLFVFGDSFFWGKKTSALGSATGPFVNHNSFALFLAVGAVLGLSLVLERARLPRMRHPAGWRWHSGANMMTLLLWSMLVVVAAALVATRSKIGIAAGAVGLGFVWAIMPRGFSAGGRNIHLWIGTGGAAAVVALTVFLGGLSVNASAPQGIAENLSRGDFVAQVRLMILARPLSGYGLDAFSGAYELFHRAPVSPEFIWDKSPSAYLTLWVELGVLFGTLPLIAAAGLLARLVGVLRLRRHDVALVVSALAALVVVAVHSTADFGIEIQANQFLLLAVLALGLARRVVPEQMGGGG